MRAAERSHLTLMADWALLTALAVFVLVGQPDSGESASARAASVSAHGATPELRLELDPEGRFRIANRTGLFTADELFTAVTGGTTNTAPRVIAMAYRADFRAGQVHTALLNLQRVFPKAELNQVIQTQPR